MELSTFIPPELINESTPIEVDESMAPIVGRICQYLPIEEIWRRFSSDGNETAGAIRFPYYRVDATIQTVRFELSSAEESIQVNNPEEEQYFYQRASNAVMEIVLWVEVGFEGLKNLAIHPASKNWTSGVGHHVSDKQRVKGIMTNGQKSYDSVMCRFVEFRDRRQITKDCFTEIHLESILQRWR